MCVGDSRISEPCYDDLNSGKCTAFGVLTCQAYCWWTPGCAIFVVYSVLDAGDNMDGSCVLCYDLHNSEPTPNKRTRAYRYTQLDRGLPPAPPSQPSPSPPPKPPPPPPPPLPSTIEEIGEDRMASCSYFAPYELVYTDDDTSSPSSVDRDISTSSTQASPPPPSGNAMAYAQVDHTGNATECCVLCAKDETCQGFVFEQGSHVCVSLPLTQGQRLVPRYNAGMTAGFVRRFEGSSASPPPSPPPAQCTLKHDMGFSSGGGDKIGDAKPPEGTLMSSPEVCCGVCAADKECVKFSFKARSWAPGIGDCVMYRATAEAFVKAGEGLIAGTVMSRDIERDFLDPPAPPFVGIKSPPPAPPNFPGRMSFEHHSSNGLIDGDDPTGIMVGAATSFMGAIIVICLVARWAMSAGSARKGKFAPVTPSPRGRKPGKAVERARLAMQTPDSEDDDDDDDDDDDGPSGRGAKSALASSGTSSFCSS